MADVAIIVPTLRRPDSLERALRSLFAQTRVDDRVSEIVVVDKDPLGSAAGGVEALRRLAPWPLVYVHAPRPGVATARNAGLDEQRAQRPFEALGPPQGRDDDGDIAHHTASA